VHPAMVLVHPCLYKVAQVPLVADQWQFVRPVLELM
jgi:hypothetical protein